MLTFDRLSAKKCLHVINKFYFRQVIAQSRKVSAPLDVIVIQCFYTQSLSRRGTSRLPWREAPLQKFLWRADPDNDERRTL
jgi:hypothetical protein